MNSPSRYPSGSFAKKFFLHAVQLDILAAVISIALLALITRLSLRIPSGIPTPVPFTIAVSIACKYATAITSTSFVSKSEIVRSCERND